MEEYVVTILNEKLVRRERSGEGGFGGFVGRLVSEVVEWGGGGGGRCECVVVSDRSC